MKEFAGYLSVLFYLVTWTMVVVQTHRLKFHTQLPRPVMLILWGVAVILHAIYLYLPLFYDQSLIMNLTYATSHVLCIANAILLITLFTHRVDIIGIYILPLAIVFTSINLLFPPGENEVNEVFLVGTTGIHVLVSLLGYSLLALATMQAMLVSFQNAYLHGHTNHPFMNVLPSLQDMERFLFHLLIAGVVFLGASLVTGFIFFDNLFEQNVIHKTILSIIAFILYSLLLFGHWQFGWRGKTAVNLTIAAFFILLIGFMGSKYVYEYLLPPTDNQAIEIPIS